MPAALCLEVAEYTDTEHWRWVLTDGGGAFLADHTVALDRAAPEWAALYDLPGYLRLHAAPDRRAAEEPLLARRAGAWIGAALLGPIGPKLVELANPSVVVRVKVPAASAHLLTLPLELAHVRDTPLSLHGVGFVFEPEGARPPTAATLGPRLRVLALFSLPPAGSPLNLRRERQMLRDLVKDLTGSRNLAVELRVLQYGVTRERLEAVLAEEEGWDIVHFSGHGLPGALLLEHPDGRRDDMSGEELAALLLQSGSKLKLVVLSACLSAAASIEQTLAWLGLSEEAAPRATAAAPADAQAAPTVARALTGALGCAVLAMRYAVEDDFAITLGRELYSALFTARQHLPRATHTALKKAVNAPRAPGAVSAAAPALFGARAAELSFELPKAPKGKLEPPPVGLALLRRREPKHFVGRTLAMTRASAALARAADIPGLLFLGMAGAGKTSCAAELALHHAEVDRFQHFVWFSAPEQGKDIALALRDLALAIEQQLPGVAMVHLVDQAAALQAWLPQFTALLDEHAALIVLDNLESLLTPAGQWRDPRWALLMQALLVPGGLSRVVLTSRIRPAGLPDGTVEIPVHALSRDEAFLLARDLPNLGRLLGGRMPGVAVDAGRALVRRALLLVQGHPKLLELAEAQAADPQQLAARLAQATAASGRGEAELAAFFRLGESQSGEAAFLAGLRAWTEGIAAALPEPARLFFHFLCALEEDDREGGIIAANWADLWQRLQRPAPAPDPAALLAPLLQAALVERQAFGEQAGAFRLAIHPGVAEAGRAAAGEASQPAVDAELAAMWRAVMQQSLAAHGKHPDAAARIVRAGLAAFPYLSRGGAWEAAAWMLERAWAFGDQSPAAVAAVLPLVRRIAAATAGTDGEAGNRRLLAAILARAGRADEAEALQRAAMAQAAAAADFATASSAAGDLADLLRQAGRPDEALQVLDQKVEFTRRAGFGPWAQLGDEARRLQVLVALGRSEEVLRRVLQLRDDMKGLPDPPGPEDWSVQVWNVRETVLDTGLAAVLGREAWAQALELNADIQGSKQARGAPAQERTRTRFNDYGPLLRLGRHDQARALLLHCRDAYEAANDVVRLGRVFSALADLEDKVGHRDEAVRFEQKALRYRYAGSPPGDCAISHFNLANYLTRTGGAPRVILAHRLAAVLIGIATQSGFTPQTVGAFAADLRRAGAQSTAALPADFAALCATVEEVEGVYFRDLMARLPGGSEEECNDVLRQVIAHATAAAAGPDS